MTGQSSSCVSALLLLIRFPTAPSLANISAAVKSTLGLPRHANISKMTTTVVHVSAIFFSNLSSVVFVLRSLVYDGRIVISPAASGLSLTSQASHFMHPNNVLHVFMSNRISSCPTALTFTLCTHTPDFNPSTPKKITKKRYL